MSVAFVDTQYFVAIFQESDQYHKWAVEIESQIGGFIFVTTDSILVEVMNYFSGYEENVRNDLSAVISDILIDGNFAVIE